MLSLVTLDASRMDQAAPAHQALHLSVTTWQGLGQLGTWRRPRGRPRRCWVEQITTDAALSLPDAWSAATDRSAWRALRPTVGQAWERERERLCAGGPKNYKNSNSLLMQHGNCTLLYTIYKLRFAQRLVNCSRWLGLRPRNFSSLA